MSEGQAWRSEDTGVFSFKVFLAPAHRFHLLTSLRTALTAAAFSEAERIVFAPEGLLLAHNFLFKCGIRVDTNLFLRLILVDK
jgi:hypothetical protein